jgi:hemolysin III
MRPRESFNAYSHLLGAVSVVVGIVYLLTTRDQGLWSYLVYGLMTGFLFTSSTIYHWTQNVSDRLQKMDHCAIYLMIAGCYTPISTIAVTGSLGWGILFVEWLLAAIGVTATLVMTKPPTWLRLVLYLAMGWMILPFMGAVTQRLPQAGLVWMICGGLAYTVGTIVYASKRPTLWPGKFSFHELWHVFVLAGAVCFTCRTRQ